jgi:diadenosine tetraphosphate (Ap4A) HIT family hydrolase
MKRNDDIAKAPDNPSKCIVCDVLDERDDTPARSFMTRNELPSETLASGPSFAAVTDVAPLAPGHILLVTKQHVLAMNRLTKTALAELNAMRMHFSRQLQSLYSLPVIAFEHGLCRKASVQSCGIDHAHLHLLPTDVAMEEAFLNDFDVARLGQVAEISEATKEKDEYLLLLASSGSVLIAFPQHAASQYFRKTICTLTDREFWNWNDEILLGEAAQRREWILQLHRSWAAYADNRPR